MSYLTEVIVGFINDFITGINDAFGNLISNMFYSIVDINNNAYVKNTMLFTTALSFTLIIVVVAKQVIDTYGMETTGDSDASPLDLMIRIAQCTAAIACNAWLFDYLLDLSKKFSADFISSSGNFNVTSGINTALGLINILNGKAIIVFCVAILIIVIGFVCFSVVAAIRGGELIMMKILFPFFCLDLLTTSREKWNNFIAAYLVTFFGYAIQIFCFTMALKTFETAQLLDPLYIFGTIAWIIMSIKSPKWLDKFLYNSGVKGVTGRGMQMVAQSLVMRRGV